MDDLRLDECAKQCAQDIVQDITLAEGETLLDHRDVMFDQAHEHADGLEHVIYHHKAHAICQNCNTDAGEAFLEDVGNPDPCTYNKLATTIAYGELRHRIEKALGELISRP